MNLRRFFIRDINTVGRKERIVAGIVSTGIGGALIIWQETSEGASLEGSVLRVAISAGLAIVAVKIYNQYVKRTKQAAKELKGTETQTEKKVTPN